MNVNFEYSKTLCIEGSILLLLSLVPYVGWVLGIVGVVLLLRGIKEFANYYQDDKIYQDSLTGVKYYIIAIVAAAVAIASITIGIWSATGFTFTSGSFVPTIAFGVGLAAFLAGLIFAFVFYILASTHLRRTFNTLAEKSGEASFATAATLLWVGAILTIIFVGLALIFVAWIFATIGFSTMKSPQYQQYSNGSTSPSSPSSAQSVTQTYNATAREGI
jgi:uncharacterized membrane protein